MPGREGGMWWRTVTFNTRIERCTAVGKGRECCRLVWVEKLYLLVGKKGRNFRSHNIEITDPENSTKVDFSLINSVFRNHLL